MNPETAKALIEMVRVAAKQFAGYDGICITNLFAYRSVSPAVMKAFVDPVGLGNDRHLKKVADGASLVVAAWSQHGSFKNRSAVVREMIRRHDLHYLRITEGGEPWHPLYLPDVTKPTRWWYSRGLSN